MLEDYYAWLKVADTALPRNIFGYLIQLFLSPLRSKPFVTAPYEDPNELAKCGNIGRRSFLPDTLPDRNGPRPEMLKWMAPHRQSSQLTGEDMHKLLVQAMEELAEEFSAYVMVKTSVLEKAGDAFLLHDNISTPHIIAKMMKREIAHVHSGVGSGEYSIHTAPSPADCKRIIEGKWGERMTLAGTLVPHEYLLIYTPRTEQEVAVVKCIVAAAIRFMTGGLDVIE